MYSAPMPLLTIVPLLFKSKSTSQQNINHNQSYNKDLFAPYCLNMLLVLFSRPRAELGGL